MYILYVYIYIYIFIYLVICESHIEELCSCKKTEVKRIPSSWKSLSLKTPIRMLLSSLVSGNK